MHRTFFGDNHLMFGGPGLVRRGQQSNQSLEPRCFLSGLSMVCVPGTAVSSFLEVPSCLSGAGEKEIKGSVREKLLSFGISWSCCLVTHSMGLLYYLVLVFTLFSLAGLSIRPAAQRFPLILLYFLDLQMASSGL